MLVNQMSVKAGVSYTYGDAAHKHAVTSTSNGYSYGYDQNGNMRRRKFGTTTTYMLTYDAENHLTGVSGGTTATFVFDGDGQRVQSTIGGVTTAYVGDYFEWTGSTSTRVSYYGVYAEGNRSANGQRVAMKQGSTVYLLFGDHLGSTAITANSSGAKLGELRYKAWGETRYSSGTTYTNRRYTGQYNEASLGLYFYNSRFFDPVLGRFIQADSVIPRPGNPQTWDRFTYTINNPVRYSDPTGHDICTDDGNCSKRPQSVESVLLRYGVRLHGSFDDLQKISILGAIGAVADKMGGVQVFRSVFKTNYALLDITKGLNGAKWGCSGITAGGCTTSSHQINFVSMYGDSTPGYTGYIERRNNMVHELGHAFNGSQARSLSELLDAAMDRNPQLGREALLGENYGFASEYGMNLTWQMSVTNASTSSEIFADQFLGWTFDTWETNQSGNLTDIAKARSSWMDEHMPWFLP